MRRVSEQRHACAQVAGGLGVPSCTAAPRRRVECGGLRMCTAPPRKRRGERGGAAAPGTCPVSGAGPGGGRGREWERHGDNTGERGASGGEGADSGRSWRLFAVSGGLRGEGEAWGGLLGFEARALLGGIDVGLGALSRVGSSRGPGEGHAPRPTTPLCVATPFVCPRPLARHRSVGRSAAAAAAVHIWAWHERRALIGRGQTAAFKRATPSPR